MSDMQTVMMSELYGFGPFEMRQMPDRMSPEMMRRLLGGSFPDNGFSWDCVHHFKLEDDGTWEPYNSFGEILPAPGFKIKAVVSR